MTAEQQKMVADKLSELVGWRSLEFAEIIRRGDEWWDGRDETWNPTTADSWGHDARGFEVRRKVTASVKPKRRTERPEAK